MNFKINNFGKITEANIKLDGITVICGNNNTGKSTVGKALFSFFNSLYNHKTKIAIQKNNELQDFVFRYQDQMNIPFFLLDYNSTLKYITMHNGTFSIDDIKKCLKLKPHIEIPEEKFVPLVNYLNTPESDIINEYVLRYFNSVMNGQVKNTYSSSNSKCVITGEFKDSQSTIVFGNRTCSCKIEGYIEHTAYYINSPFTLDYLNQGSIFAMDPMNGNVVNAIHNAQTAVTADSMTNIFDSVRNKKDLEDVRAILKQAYKGDTRIEHGQYFYIENGAAFDFRNISAGLKSFALIERLLETGVLKRKDVLILDEPEIHLHSEWQIIYAELIVILQKVFDLTILLVTHSFQFLEALDFFMKKYEITDRGNYYIPKSTDKGFVMKSFGINPDELKKNLTKGSVKIANMEFEYDMEHDEDGT